MPLTRFPFIPLSLPSHPLSFPSHFPLTTSPFAISPPHSVLLTKPALLLMDESTSALDTVNEAALYDQLRKSGVTFISVGHRPTLVDFHDTVLYMERTLDGEGGEGTPQGARWELKSSAEAREQLKALAAMTN